MKHDSHSGSGGSCYGSGCGDGNGGGRQRKTAFVFHVGTPFLTVLQSMDLSILKRTIFFEVFFANSVVRIFTRPTAL